MGKVMRCPEGHSIPHRTKHGSCHTNYCAVKGDQGRPAVIKHSKKSTTQYKEAAKNRIDNDVNRTAMVLRKNIALEIATKKLVEEVKRTDLPIPVGASKELAQEGRIEQLAGTSIAAGKLGARLAFINDLPHADADEVTINNWADKKAVSLLPLAIAEKEYMLKFGDDEQREKASDRVLAMNGRHQKDGHLSGGAAIILHMEGGSIQLPYSPEVNTKPKLVEGIVRAKKSS